MYFHDELMDFNYTQLNFTWEFVSYDQNSLNFKLKFFEPLMISPLEIQDRIVFHFRNTSRNIFFSPRLNISLPKQYWTLQKPIKKQMPDTLYVQNINDGIDSTFQFMIFLVVVAVIMSFFMKGAFLYIVQLIRALQMVLHLPMMRVLLPSNVINYCSILISVAMIDFIPAEQSTDYILKYDEEKLIRIQQNIFSQIQDIGYESHYTVKNLGSVSIFTVMYFGKLPILFALMIVMKIPCVGRIKRLRIFYNKMLK